MLQMTIKFIYFSDTHELQVWLTFGIHIFRGEFVLHMFTALLGVYGLFWLVCRLS